MCDVHVQGLVEFLAFGVLAVLAIRDGSRIVDVSCGISQKHFHELSARLTRWRLEYIELERSAAHFDVVQLGRNKALNQIMVGVQPVQP